MAWSWLSRSFSPARGCPAEGEGDWSPTGGPVSRMLRRTSWDCFRHEVPPVSSVPFGMNPCPQPAAQEGRAPGAGCGSTETDLDPRSRRYSVVNAWSHVRTARGAVILRALDRPADAIDPTPINPLTPLRSGATMPAHPWLAPASSRCLLTPGRHPREHRCLLTPGRHTASNRCLLTPLRRPRAVAAR